MTRLEPDDPGWADHVIGAGWRFIAAADDVAARQVLDEAVEGISLNPRYITEFGGALVWFLREVMLKTLESSPHRDHWLMQFEGKADLSRLITTEDEL